MKDEHPAIPPAASTPTPHAPETPQALLARLQSRWGELPRIALRDFQVALGTALTASSPVSVANGTLTIEMPQEFNALHGSDPIIIEQLHLLIERLIGTRLNIVIRNDQHTSGESDDRARRYRTSTEHPLVKDLLKRFEADIMAREVMSAEEWRMRNQRT